MNIVRVSFTRSTANSSTSGGGDKSPKKIKNSLLKVFSLGISKPKGLKTQLSETGAHRENTKDTGALSQGVEENYMQRITSQVFSYQKKDSM